MKRNIPQHIGICNDAGGETTVVSIEVLHHFTDLNGGFNICEIG